MTKLTAFLGLGLTVLSAIGCGHPSARSSVDPMFKPDALRAFQDSVRVFEIRGTNGELLAKGSGLPGLSSFSQSWNADSLRLERDRCGRDAPCRMAQMDSLTHRPTRAGRWQFWYPTGQLRVVLDFRLAVDVWCGVIPEFIRYEVKVDSFAFYHPNGTVLARGVFKPARLHRENNCEGGVEVEGVAVPRTTRFFDSTGQPITDTRHRLALAATIERW